MAKGVQKKLGDQYHVELAMRYQNPSIESAIMKMKENARTKENIGSMRKTQLNRGQGFESFPFPFFKAGMKARLSKSLVCFSRHKWFAAACQKHICCLA